jgi:tRNA(Ile)-lysidine synthase
MHLLRGSGLRGLAGMAPSWGSARRPLLAVRHDNCVTWCREHDVPWREDASNAEVWCRRNAIRWEVLPFLRRYNPEVDAALAGLAGAVQSDLAYLDTQATAAYRSLVQRADGGVEQLALAGYLAMPAALRHRVLLLWLGPNARRVHVHAVDRLLRAGRAGEAIAVPGGRQVVKQYDDAILVPPTEQPIMPVLTITVPGETRVPGWSWTIRAEWLRGPARQDLDRWSVDLDAKRVQLPLTLRGRRAGDRFLLPGQAGAKKLQDMLVDAKMPRRERDRLGIVEAANGIVWLAGWRAAAWAAADTASERILRLSVAHSGSRKQE